MFRSFEGAEGVCLASSAVASLVVQKRVTDLATLTSVWLSKSQEGLPTEDTDSRRRISQINSNASRFDDSQVQVFLIVALFLLMNVVTGSVAIVRKQEAEFQRHKFNSNRYHQTPSAISIRISAASMIQFELELSSALLP